jgi:hypothetical protein
VIPEQDPNLFAYLSSRFLPWFAGAVLTISIAVWGFFFNRFFKKQDDFDKRLSELEAKSATHTDLHQLHKKIESQGTEINNQLSDIYKLLIEMAAKR